MKFERLARRIVYQNPWIRFEAHDIVHPNGTPGEHGLVIPPAASAVVVLDDGIVLFTCQARFAVDMVVLEIVKGGRERGESALDGARRETREEVGAEAGRWDSLGVAYELPSIVQEPVALFLARDIRYGAQALEQIESIDTIRMPFEAALSAVASGEINDAVTALALFRTQRLIERERTTI